MSFFLHGHGGKRKERDVFLLPGRGESGSSNAAACIFVSMDRLEKVKDLLCVTTQIHNADNHLTMMWVMLEILLPMGEGLPSSLCFVICGYKKTYPCLFNIGDQAIAMLERFQLFGKLYCLY